MSPSELLREPVFENVAQPARPGSAQTCPNPPNFEKSSQQDPVSLNEKQLAAIELLASGRSFSLAAKEIGVGRRTLFDWRQKEAFRTALRQRHRELWGDVNDRLRMLVDPSVEVLAEHLDDRYDRARFRAATAILRFANIGKNMSE